MQRLTDEALAQAQTLASEANRQDACAFAYYLCDFASQEARNRALSGSAAAMGCAAFAGIMLARAILSATEDKQQQVASTLVELFDESLLMTLKLAGVEVISCPSHKTES